MFAAFSFGFLFLQWYIIQPIFAQASLPSCAQSCVVLPSSCSSVDVTCICNDAAWISSTCSCVQSTCDATDLQASVNYLVAICAPVGVSVSCPAASSSSSSTSTTPSTTTVQSTTPAPPPTTTTQSTTPAAPSSSSTTESLTTTSENPATPFSSTLTTFTRSQSPNNSPASFTATDTSDIISYIQTAIPEEVRSESSYACFVNSQYDYYSTPTWYTALPTQVQTYYSSINQGVTAACTLKPSQTAAASGGSSPGLSTGEKAGAAVGAVGGVAAVAAIVALAVKAGLLTGLGLGGAAAAGAAGTAGVAGAAGAAGAAAGGAAGGTAGGAAGGTSAGLGSSGAAGTTQTSQALWAGQAGFQAANANLGLSSTGAEHAWTGQSGAENAWNGQAGAQSAWAGQAGSAYAAAPASVPANAAQIPIIPLVAVPYNRRQDSTEKQLQTRVQSIPSNMNEPLTNNPPGMGGNPEMSQRSSPLPLSSHYHYHRPAENVPVSPNSSNAPWIGYSNESTRGEMSGDYFVQPPQAQPGPMNNYGQYVGYSAQPGVHNIVRHPAEADSRQTSPGYYPGSSPGYNGVHGRLSRGTSNEMYTGHGGGGISSYRGTSSPNPRNNNVRHESGGDEIYESGAQSVYESGSNTLPPQR